MCVCMYAGDIERGERSDQRVVSVIQYKTTERRERDREIEGGGGGGGGGRERERERERVPKINPVGY